MHLNIASLALHLDELKILLAKLNIEFDVITLTEIRYKSTNTNIINYCLNMSDPNIQSITAEYVRNILCMYKEETDGTVQPIVQTIITRVGRIIRKPERLGVQPDR